MLNVMKQRTPATVVHTAVGIINNLYNEIVASVDGDVIRNMYRVYKHPSHEIDAGCIVHVRFEEIQGSRQLCIDAISEACGVDPSPVHLQDDWLKICKLEVGEKIHPHVDLFNDCTLSCMIPLTTYTGGTFKLLSKEVPLSVGDVAIFNRGQEHQIDPIESGTALIAFTGFKLML